MAEIIVWANEFPPTPEIEATGARLLYSATNEVVLGRYLAAQQAAHEAVFVQDDDLLVSNLDTLLAAFDEEGGRKLICNLASDKSSRHWEWWAVNHPAHCEVGFGSIITRSAASRLNDWPYSRDVLRRKSDKIATVVHPWRALRAGPGAITRLFHQGKESGRDEHALSNLTDHQSLTAEAVRLAQKWAGVAAVAAE